MPNWLKRDGGPEMVSASEIGEFVYCAEAWRLARALGVPAGNQAALDAGARKHRQMAMRERVAGGAIGLGRTLVIAAVLVLLALLWLVWR
jgi:hypothetical protein